MAELKCVSVLGFLQNFPFVSTTDRFDLRALAKSAGLTQYDSKHMHLR
jgi:hypothetical protein